MTVEREFYVRCDECRARYGPSKGDEVKARLSAQKVGWVRDGRQDLCPGCRGRKWRAGLDELGREQAARRAGRRV